MRLAFSIVFLCLTSCKFSPESRSTLAELELPRDVETEKRNKEVFKSAGIVDFKNPESQRVYEKYAYAKFDAVVGTDNGKRVQESFENELEALPNHGALHVRQRLNRDKFLFSSRIQSVHEDVIRSKASGGNYKWIESHLSKLIQDERQRLILGGWTESR